MMASKLSKSTRHCDIYGFRPPHLTVSFVELAKLIYPALLRLRYGHLSYETVGDLNELTSLGTKRVILCPNHSLNMDNDVVFLLAKLLRDQLYYLCTREIFRKTIFNKFILQLAGCYSVHRGALDLRSFAQSIKILMQGKHRLVIFPEGEISGRNNVLLPFKSGPAHIALSAVARMRKEHREELVYLAPIAFRYSYPKVTAKFLLDNISSIEHVLQIDGGTDLSLQHRISKALNVIIDTLYEKYNTQPPSLPLSEKAHQLTQLIFTSLAAYVHYEPVDGLNEVESAHQLYLRLYEARWTEEQLQHQLNRSIHHTRYQALNELIHDYHRAVNLISASQLAERSNVEDLVNLIMAVRKEVGADQHSRTPVHLSIAFAKPILVNDFLKGQTEGVDVPHELTKLLESSVREELNKLIV